MKEVWCWMLRGWVQKTLRGHLPSSASFIQSYAIIPEEHFDSSAIHLIPVLNFWGWLNRNCRRKPSSSLHGSWDLGLSVWICAVKLRWWCSWAAAILKSSIELFRDGPFGSILWLCQSSWYRIEEMRGLIAFRIMQGQVIFEFSTSFNLITRELVLFQQSVNFYQQNHIKEW